ncbi:hypothetical protein AAEX28_05950 [Lentisphaerota bacterium WC36G]|nr:hypothetical protein LJT99_08810 [Lentisphaerae bacterium WC36]
MSSTVGDSCYYMIRDIITKFPLKVSLSEISIVYCGEIFTKETVKKEA